MVNSKFIRSVAGASTLFAAVAVHAQVLIEDTAKPGNSGDLQTGQTAQAATSPREGSVPTSSRDAATSTTQFGASAGGMSATGPAADSARSAGSMQSAGGQQSQLQQGVLQSSERQSGTVQTGMVNGARQDAAATQSGASQSGATQSSGTQSGQSMRDPANVPLATERSREAKDAQSGVSQETMRGRSGTAGSGASGAGALSRNDRKAIMDMAMANMAEVEMGKLAQSKGTSEEVKTFGQQMIDDHGKALAEVQALAQAKGVALPTQLDAKHQKAADRLNAKSGAAFDKAYMERAGVKDHMEVRAKLNGIESQARDPDVKALAAKMMPVVQQHLNSAQQLSKARNTSKPDTASGNR